MFSSIQLLVTHIAIAYNAYLLALYAAINLCFSIISKLVVKIKKYSWKLKISFAIIAIALCRRIRNGKRHAVYHFYSRKNFFNSSYLYMYRNSDIGFANNDFKLDAQKKSR